MTLYERACSVSSAVAHGFGHPYGFVIFPFVCAAAIALALPMNAQTYILSVVAISASQAILVVALQDRAEDVRRDKALHAKINELILAMNGARDELAGVEERTAEEIDQLRP